MPPAYIFGQDYYWCGHTLVPGLHITNAVRDLLAGHLVAGLSKGVEALLTAFAIGAGIAVVLAFV